jgi:OmpA family/PEGA domain
MRTRFLTSALLASSCAVLFLAASAFAQTSADMGRLHIHVQPKQAYVFVDGKAIRDGSQTISLPAGTHTVSVHNYGYLANTQKVDIRSGQKTHLDVALQPSGDRVSGPFADLEFKGHPRAAVLLNGTTPDYFVGHVDEFDWDWIWHQRLLVHPGTYHVMVTREGNTIWSGTVTAQAGQKVIIHLDSGKTTTKNFSPGMKLGPQPRFEAGIASATVPVAPVTAVLDAKNTQLTCGQSTDLNWKSANSVENSITTLGNVSGSGDRSVRPTKTITYQLVAKGPGGDVTRSVTVDVSGEPTAALALAQPEVHFRKVGDKVVEQGSTNLNWTTSGASSVTIQPLGSEMTNGSQTILASPKQTTDGPVNEDVTYTLTAANACGGTTTKTATLHVVGSIDPAPAVTLASLFYPTAYPTRHHPKVGLVRSERESLAKLAASFKNHQEYAGNSNLLIVGHADVRGSKKYNMRLSERRAELVKSCLVSQGVPADRIEIRALGKSQQLNETQVKELQAKDPQRPEMWMLRNRKVTWLAYNRRADVVLQPAGVQSAKMYPNDVPSARILWQRHVPSIKAVEVASRMTGPANGQFSASTSGN